MVEKTELYQREEEQLREVSGPSSTPTKIAREVMGLKEVKGLTIVDLASGTTGVVAELLSEGADAHGVDIVYDRPNDQLVQEALKVLTEVCSDAPFGVGPEMFAQGESSLNQFASSYQPNSTNYHKGYLTRVPLPDNFADVTTSLNGILAMAEDVDLTVEQVNEALRITKPGGKVVLAPVHTPYNFYFSYFSQQHDQVIKTIESQGYKIELEEISVNSTLPLPDFTRLTIFKPIS